MSANQTPTDYSQFILGLTSGLVLAIIGSVITFLIQSRLQKEQFKHEKSNLELQQKQNETNLKLQLSHEEQKRAIEELFKIINSDIKSYRDMRTKLLEFL